MAWLPGITTLDAGSIFRNQSRIGNDSNILINLQNRTALQWMNYHNSDIFTPINASIARFQQVNIPDRFTTDLQPRVQLSDIIEARSKR